MWKCEVGVTMEMIISDQRNTAPKRKKYRLIQMYGNDIDIGLKNKECY